MSHHEKKGAPDVRSEMGDKKASTTKSGDAAKAGTAAKKAPKSK